MSKGVERFIDAKLGGNPDTTVNDNITVECPSCGKPNMYVHRQKGLAFCFSCEYKANLARLIRDVTGIPYEIAQIQANKLLKDAYKEDAASIPISGLITLLLGKIGEKQGKTEVVHLPENAKPVERTLGARYLTSRGFNPELVAPYKLKYCERTAAFSPTSNHIIFPDYHPDTGVLRYWTTRAAYEPPKGKHKTYNPAGIPRKGILYGAFAAARDKPVIITEGPLDAIACGGVSLLGKYMSYEHAWYLAETYDHIVICLDEDAKEFTIKAIELLMAAGAARVSLSYLPYKDPAASPEKGKRLYERILAGAVDASGANLIRQKLLL